MKTKLLSIIFLSIILSACNSTAPKKDFESVKEAVDKQIALKCEYSDNGQVTTTYIKGQVVRLIGNEQSSGIEGLIKDTQFYLWNTQDKKGMVIDITKMEGAKMGETSIKSVSDVITELEKNKESCTKVSENEVSFELPTDISFTSTSDISK